MKIINETKQSTDKAYFDMMSNRFSPQDIAMVKQGDQMAERMFGARIQTEESDSGDSIIRFIDGDDVVAILGIVTRTGIKRADLNDFKIWSDRLLNALVSGKTVMASPNELTGQMLDRLIQKAKAKGINLIKQEGQRTPMGGRVYIDTIIKMEGKIMKSFKSISLKENIKIGNLNLKPGTKIFFEAEEDYEFTDTKIENSVEYNRDTAKEAIIRAFAEDGYTVNEISIGGYGEKFKVETEESGIYIVFDDENDVKRYAIDIAKERLEEDSESFSLDWLKDFLYVTEIDARQIALDMADGMDFESEDEEEEYVDMTEEQILNDPVGYFVDEQGMYSLEDLAKQNFISIDYDAAAKSAVDMDGMENYLGEEIEITDPLTDKTFYAYME
jgi:hypothetical protein